MMGLFGLGKKAAMPSPEKALPGRSEPMPVPEKHFVNGNSLQPPFPEQMEMAMFGLGCFWGAERKFWQQKGFIPPQSVIVADTPKSDISRSLYWYDGT